MSADSIAISRELVREGGLEQKAADIIAQKIVAHFDAGAASEAVARVEAKVDAERETKSDRLDRIDDRLDRMEDRLDKMDNRLNKIEHRLIRSETIDKLIIGLLIAVFAGVAVLVIDKVF